MPLFHLGSDRYRVVTDRHQDRITIANTRYSTIAMAALARKNGATVFGRTLPASTNMQAKIV